MNNVIVPKSGIYADGDLAILLTGDNYVSGDIYSNNGSTYYSLLLFGLGSLTVNAQYDGIKCGALSVCAVPSVIVIDGGVSANNILISMSSVLIQSPTYGISGQTINILGSIVAMHSGLNNSGDHIGLGRMPSGHSSIAIDGSIVSIMHEESWRGVWTRTLSVTHSYFSCVVPKGGWGCICADHVYFDNSIAKLYSKVSKPFDKSYVGDVTFGEGDYYIASGSQAYTVGAEDVTINGGNVQICSAGEESSAVEANHFKIDAGRLEVIDKVDVREFLLYDAAAAALYTGVVAGGAIDISAFMANFYSQVILDAISNAKIGDLKGVPNIGVNCGTYTQECGTVWCDLPKFGVVASNSPIINGGSYKGKFLNSSYYTFTNGLENIDVLSSASGVTTKLECAPYVVAGAKKYDKVSQLWSGILPSYYGTGSLYADEGGCLYFWLPSSSTGSGGDTDYYPDLSPYTPRGWSAPLVVSSSSTSTEGATNFSTSDSLYLSWAFSCGGADIAETLYIRLFVDGNNMYTWDFHDGLQKEHYMWVDGYSIGNLAPGTHTIRVVADATDTVIESSESNNSIEQIITVTVNGGTDLAASETNGGSLTSPGYKAIEEKDITAPYVAPKIVTLHGVAYDGGGAVVGVVELKLGKVNDKKKTSKVSGSFTGLDGKKITIKAENVTGVDSTAPVTVSLEVKGHGTMTVTIGGEQFAGSLGGWHVQSGTVGGDWTRADARVYVDGALGERALPEGTVAELLPDGEPVVAAGGKWKFAKAASVKWAKPKKGAEQPEVFDPESGKGLIVDTSKGGNLSGMKLSYTPKKGTFKGSFKVYALEGSGKATKLKKYTVKVSGVVVGGVGHGVATCKKPAVSWAVTVK